MTKHSLTRRACLVALAILVISSVLGLAACGGGGSTDSTSSGGGNTYTDKTYGFSFAYPDGWEIQETAGQAGVSSGAAPVVSVAAYDPKGAIAGNSYTDILEVSLYKLSGEVDDSVMAQLETEVKGVFDDLQTQAADMKIVEPMASVTLGSLKGWKITYSFDKNGAPAESTLYLMFGGSFEYQLLVQAATETWQADQAGFQAFVSSFRPGTTTATTAK
jgi:hypothetical protein